MVYVWSPPREVVEAANVYKFMERIGVKSYGELVQRSIREFSWFWWNLPRWLNVSWFREPRELVDLSKGVEWAKWYIGGRLNLAYNVVDRIVELGFGGREAFTWVGEDGSVRRFSYSELKSLVDRFANYLREVGVGVGDVVAIYAPMLPESIAAMLATVKVGAIAAPIFSGFSAPAVAERLKLSEPKVLVTVDGYLRRGRKIVLKREADKAVSISNCKCQVVVVRRLGVDVPWNDERDIWFDRAVAGKRPSAEPEEVDAEHPALLLFTSGTTGKPKGAVISHIGALLQPSKEHYFNLDIKAVWEEPDYRDKLWWITDIGWMMGPWQVIGAQFLGQSHLVVEGALDYPTRTRAWDLIEEHGVTHFGFAATAARMLKRMTRREDLEEYGFEKLRAFGNTGEPIDEPTWMWIMREVGREKRPLINLSGGTEIFGCFLLPSPVVSLKPSTLWGPGLGMDVDVFDDSGKPVREQIGYLVAKKPTPSMTRGLWRDPERYIKTYWSRFPGVWFHGDLAYIDEDGYWYILGRADDVIKVAGRRVGPAEIEAAVNTHKAIAESACIGVPHELKGEVIACFVVPRESVDPEQLEGEVRRIVEEKLGKPFKPEYVFVVDELPKTRSGKIVRRLIRSLVRGLPLGDTSTLENPHSIEKVKRVLEERGLIAKSG